MRLRTTVVLGAASLIATCASAAAPLDRQIGWRTDPVPIRGGIQVPGGPLIHVFRPGPDSIGSMGERIDPCTITDFKGFFAVASLRGTATDREGTTFDADFDIRVFQGEYVGSEGRHDHGTFALVAIDLFESGTDSRVQLHAFHPNGRRSDPFWTVRIPDDALELGSGTARLKVSDLEVIDRFTFLGPNDVPARVDLDITFRASGRSLRHRPATHDPIDAANFDAELHPAFASGTFAGREPGFRFTARGSSSGGFAETGRERNGVFLFEQDEFIAPVDLFDEEGFPGEIDIAHATQNPDARRNPFGVRIAARCALSVDPFDLVASKSTHPARTATADREMSIGSLSRATFRRLSPGVFLMRPVSDLVRPARIVLLR